MSLLLAGVAIVGVALRAPSPTMVLSMKDTKSYISSLLTTAESTSPFWPKPKDWTSETAAMRQYITKMNHLEPPVSAGNTLPLSPSGKAPSVAAAEPASSSAAAPAEVLRATATTRQYIAMMNALDTPAAAAEPTAAAAAAPAADLAALRSECEAALLERARRSKLCDLRLDGFKAVNERAQRTKLCDLRLEGCKAVNERALRTKLCDLRLDGSKAVKERALRTKLCNLRMEGAKAVAMRAERMARLSELSGVAMPTSAAEKVALVAPEGFEWAAAVF